MLKKLRIKFVCINMTIITIMLIFILCTIIQFTRHNLEQTNIQMMQQIATNPFYMIKPTDHFDVRLPYFSLQLNDNGDLLESLGSYYDLSDPVFLEELIDASLQAPEKTGLLKDYNLRYMRVPAPSGQFLIFVDISTEISTVNTLTRNCIFIGIFSFFVFLGISIFFANWAIKPVDKAWRQQKQFIADASHELKTPLTVILTNAELLQASDYGTEHKAHFSENILIMARQMRSLVEGLLELSRIDNHSMKTVMKDLDFSTLTELSLSIFEPLYFEKGLELNAEIDPDIRLKGSESHLKQVIEILLDNALKYAAPQSQVTVKLQKQRFYCVLSVKSLGDTLSEEDLKNIFKRFYRTDKSRSSTRNRSPKSDEAVSYGLGLSIAESIITEHHGKIWAESKDGVNTFFVRLLCGQ